MSITAILEKGSDLRKLGNELLNNEKKDRMSEKTVIVSYGLMNAGKSFLLNMLTGHITTEYFKTNDIRETVVSKMIDTGQYIYLDTPGLDAKTKDDLEAFKGVKKADIVLFVHQIQGELEKQEIDFLKSLSLSFGQYAHENIIIILSKIDKEASNLAKVEQIQIKVLEQCEQHLGFKPKIFLISNRYYQKGVQSHKDGLVRHSHINDLKQRIDEVVANSSQVYQQRLKNEKAQLIEQLLAHKKVVQQGIDIRQSEINDSFSDFQQMLSNLKSFVVKQTQQYKIM